MMAESGDVQHSSLSERDLSGDEKMSKGVNGVKYMNLMNQCCVN